MRFYGLNALTDSYDRQNLDKSVFLFNDFPGRWPLGFRPGDPEYRRRTPGEIFMYAERYMPSNDV
tara:strand:+ start:903 stop:1097 length:195 start_codon:yes stop_codon:yes gene_type:complete